MENYCIKSAFALNVTTCIRKHKLRSIRKNNKEYKDEIDRIMCEYGCGYDEEMEMVYSFCYAYKQEYIREFVLDSHEAIYKIYNFVCDHFKDTSASFNYSLIPRIVDFKGNDLYRYNYDDICTSNFDDTPDVCVSDYETGSESSSDEEDYEYQKGDSCCGSSLSVSSRRSSNGSQSNGSRKQDDEEDDYVPSPKSPKVDSITEAINSVGAGQNILAMMNTIPETIVENKTSTTKPKSPQQSPPRSPSRNTQVRKRKIPAPSVEVEDIIVLD